MAARFSVLVVVLMMGFVPPLVIASDGLDANEIQNILCEKDVCKCENKYHNELNGLQNVYEIKCTYSRNKGPTNNTKKNVIVEFPMLTLHGSGTYDLTISDQMLANFQIRLLKLTEFNKLYIKPHNLTIKESKLNVTITKVKELELDSKAFKSVNETVDLKVENCSTVRLKKEIGENLRSFYIHSVEDLDVSKNTFNASMDSFEKVEIINTTVKDFPENAFGNVKNIILNSVAVESIESNAFSKNATVESLKIIDCTFNKIQKNAFTSNVASMDIENTKFKDIEQSAIEVNGNLTLRNNKYTYKDFPNLFLLKVNTKDNHIQLMNEYLNAYLCQKSECKCISVSTDQNNSWKGICEFTKNGTLSTIEAHPLAEQLVAVELKGYPNTNLNLTIKEGTFKMYQNLSTFEINEFHHVIISQDSLPIVKSTSNLNITIKNVAKLELGSNIVPKLPGNGTVVVSVKDCNTTQLSSEVVTNLQSFEIQSVNDLTLSENTFKSVSLEKVEIINTTVKIFPKKAFGSGKNIILNSVVVESIESNAFSKNAVVENLKINNCTFNKINENAFTSNVAYMDIENTKLMNVDTAAINVYANLTLRKNTYDIPIKTIFKSHGNITVHGDNFRKEEDVKKYFELSSTMSVHFSDNLTEPSFTITDVMKSFKTTTEIKTTEKSPEAITNTTKENTDDQPETSTSSHKFVIILLLTTAVILIGSGVVYYFVINKKESFNVSTANNNSI